MISSWQSGENAITSYGEVLSQNTSAFIGNIMQVEQETWNLQVQANSTADTLAYMFSTRADNLVNELAQSYYAEGNLNAMTNALHDSLVNTLESGYDISSITNALSSIADGAKAVASAANSASQALTSMGAQQAAYESTTRATRGKDTLYPSIFDTISSVGSGGSQLTKKLNGYASGVRKLPNDEIAVTQEDGTEIILSPVRGGVLLPEEAFINKKGSSTVLKKGDTVLTAEQTDNMFEWSKIDPEEVMKWSKINPGELMKGMNIIPQNINQNLPKFEPRPVNNNINIDNVLTVNGSIDNGNIKQMEAIANKAVDNLVNKLHDGIMYGR